MPIASLLADPVDFFLWPRMGSQLHGDQGRSSVPSTARRNSRTISVDEL